MSAYNNNIAQFSLISGKLASKTTLILSSLLIATAAFSQQDPIFSQYLMNPLVLNPAYAGINNNLNVTASYRAQWVKLEGQPQTLNLNGSSSVLDNKLGVGLTLLQDRVGNATISDFNASVAYKLKVSDEYSLSFGMQVGALGFKTDNSELTIRHSGDAAFPDGATRASTVNLGAGAILKSEQWLVGLSVPRMLPTKINSGGQQFELYKQHFYLFASYAYILNEHINLKPSVLLRGVGGAPASVDINAAMTFNMIHTAGVFTRNFKTYGLLLQTLIKEKLRVGYVFELPTNKSVGPTFKTHEIVVGIRMGVFNFHDRSLTTF
jgi:type IX secretion system PorP/SprF family membrane protein